MSSDLRALLANRRFAIPLIALLGIAFVGMILVGVILITRPGSDDGSQVALATSTPESEPTERSTATALPSATLEPAATPTLVPVGTSESPSATDIALTSTSEAESSSQATPGSGNTPVATAAAPAEEELADTGVGWGLILVSAIGLSGLVVVARRLRLA